MEQEDTLCDEVETVREHTYVSGRVSACGRCEAAAIDGTRCSWIKHRKCNELLYGK